MLTLTALLFVAAALTCTMFASKQMMLGFPSAIFWALAGGQSYTISTALWDLPYLTFFASLGIAIFCMFAAFALRTKKEELAVGDEFIDEGKDDMVFIDEGGNGSHSTLEDESELDGEKPSRRTRDIRERAERRRTRWK